MKNCTKCGVKKDDNCFYINKLWCKSCCKQYKLDNKETIKEYKKQFNANNKEAIKEYKKQYRLDHKEIIKENRRNYNLQNRGMINKYQRTKYENNSAFKLRQIISSSIRKILKINGMSKGGSSFIQSIGYTIQELRDHLEKQFEPWMTWHNHGKYDVKTWDDVDSNTWTWQIDHIVPHSTFNYTSMKDQTFKDCWRLSNLRPLSAKQNIKEGNRR